MGDVQKVQEQREGELGRSDLPQQHGGAGDTAVVQIQRAQEHGYAHGVDAASRHQQQKILSAQFFQFPEIMHPFFLFQVCTPFSIYVNIFMIPYFFKKRKQDFHPNGRNPAYLKILQTAIVTPAPRISFSACSAPSGT